MFLKNRKYIRFLSFQWNIIQRTFNQRFFSCQDLICTDIFSKTIVMTFSTVDHVILANDVSFEDFLAAQGRRYEEFVNTSRTEFFSADERYFRAHHEIFNAALQERRAEVNIIFIILRLFNL